MFEKIVAQISATKITIYWHKQIKIVKRTYKSRKCVKSWKVSVWSAVNWLLPRSLNRLNRMFWCYNHLKVHRQNKNEQTYSFSASSGTNWAGGTSRSPYRQQEIDFVSGLHLHGPSAQTSQSPGQPRICQTDTSQPTKLWYRIKIKKKEDIYR